MGKYDDISIRELLEEINDKTFLPEIQREFVWDSDRSKFEDKLYDLFDSIIRGFPIGTLLFWEAPYEDLVKDNITVLKLLEDNSRDNEIIDTSNFKDKEIRLVLDGQQRLTILNLAFKGVFVDNYYKRKRKRYLYFNLLSNPHNNKEVNERKYGLKLFDKNEEYFFEDGKIWFKVSNFLNTGYTKSEFRRKLYDEFNIEKDIYKDRISDNINDFKDAIQLRNISYYLIDHHKTDEEALEIFTRVNSGGVVLTYSDLLFSKIKHHWKKGEDKVDAREEFKEFLDDINSDRFKFNNDFLLKTSLFLIEKDIRYRLKNFKKENVMLIKQIWDKLKASINTTLSLLKSMGIDNHKVLKSSNSIIPIIFYIYNLNIKNIEPESNNFSSIKKYIYLILLNKVFSGQSDELLTTCRNIIKNNKTNDFPLEKILSELKKKKPIITKKDEMSEIIDESRYNTDRSKLILKLIYSNKLISDFQEDHMFPRKKMLELYKKELVDNIGNIQALGSSTNASKNDKKFVDWLNNRDNADVYMGFHLVPNLKDYSANNFMIFLNKRKEMMADKIAAVLDLK